MELFKIVNVCVCVYVSLCYVAIFRALWLQRCVEATDPDHLLLNATVKNNTKSC